MQMGKPTPVTLEALGATLNLQVNGEIEISGITHDSRSVTPGDLYFAIPGLAQHGIDFVEQAIDNGAVAVASDTRGCETAEALGLPWLLLNNPRLDMANIAAEFYGHPEQKLTMIGVTGTNGKTTITQMLRTLLEGAGRSVGVIGTLGTFVGELEIPSKRTTPESTDLFELLAQIVGAGADTVCMEVSSHALELQRVAGIKFDVAVFTNLTQDHLDFHGTMENYFAAKEKLFIDSRCRVAVIGCDDVWGRKLISSTDAQQVVSVGATGDWRISDVSSDLSGNTRFVLTTPDEKFEANIPMYGDFNAKNAALCLAVCASLGIDANTAKDSLEKLPQVPGRMQLVSQHNDSLAFVDYAHTPDAVQKVLTEILIAKPTKLITVLGCGGDRDPSKRAIMGQISAELSDVVVITDDNPRSEDPAQIRSEVFKGTLGQPAQVFEIGDRREAISFALSMAGPGDVVAVLGKGHEVGQEINGEITDFDDAKVIREVIARG
jgi:UDP-N-acetylmuramoyl-L-alanyl-D-glutamate--2,6-diaminopimelate ligase